VESEPSSAGAILAFVPRVDHAVSKRLDVAARLASRARSLDPNVIVVVFGSTARGDATHESDLDLLIISGEATRLDSIRRLCKDVRVPRVSLLTHTWSSFERLRYEDWLFIKHLSEEALPLLDALGDFSRRCQINFPGDRAVIAEIRRHSRGIAQLTDLDRYGGDFLFPLANAYALTKRIAMLANSRAGVRIYHRDRALTACEELFPAAADDLRELRQLAPFYARTRGVHSSPTPFSSDLAESELLSSAAALQRLVAVACVE
jgi:predicted nucleotidyltransferase